MSAQGFAASTFFASHRDTRQTSYYIEILSSESARQAKAFADVRRLFRDDCLHVTTEKKGGGRSKIQQGPTTLLHAHHTQLRSPLCPTRSKPRWAGGTLDLDSWQRLRQWSLGSTIVAKEPARDLEVNWDSLGFGISHTGKMMYRAEWSEHGWRGGMEPYQCLQVDPAAQVLNYGQSIFEGLKAQRTVDDKVVLFRPNENAKRMRAGAARLEMEAPPEDMFISAVTEAVKANRQYVPPHGKGSLYLRPLLLGTGPILGLGPAPGFTFLVYAAAVGAYFKAGQLAPIDLLVETRFHRAAPGGMGGTKAAGNYSPVLKTQLEAKNQGYADVVYLDAVSDTYLEEVSSCNIFVVKGSTIKTPPLHGTILPGITRASVIELARQRGYTVEEAPVSVEEAMDADEIFTTGTAVVLCAVGSLTYKGRRKQYQKSGSPGPIAWELYSALTDIQSGKAKDVFQWVWTVQ